MVLLCAPRLEAQTIRPKAATPTKKATPAEIAAADVAVTANITARELRFDQVGQLKVEFPGAPRRITIWEEERQNLARPAQPGVTYRDIGSQLRVTSRFEEIERIVAEALGAIAGQGAVPVPKTTFGTLGTSQTPFPAIPAPLAPLPVVAAPKAVLSPKPVLPVKPLPARSD